MFPAKEHSLQTDHVFPSIHAGSQALTEHMLQVTCWIIGCPATFQSFTSGTALYAEACSAAAGLRLRQARTGTQTLMRTWGRDPRLPPPGVFVGKRGRREPKPGLVPASHWWAGCLSPLQPVLARFLRTPRRRARRTPALCPPRQAPPGAPASVRPLGKDRLVSIVSINW